MAFAPAPIGGIDVDRYGVKFDADWVWLPVVAGGDPTESEINAGWLLTGAVAAVAGFNITPVYDDIPDVTQEANPRIFVGGSLDPSVISFYLAGDDDDALEVFTEGDTGFVLHCPAGLDYEARAWLWPVEVSAAAPMPSMTGAALGVIAFANVAAPDRVILPAEPPPGVGDYTDLYADLY